MSDAAVERPSVRELAALAVPGVVVGVLSGLLMVIVNKLSHGLEHVLWETLPHSLGIDPDAALWIIGILTFTGIAVGLVVWLAPGHGGDDPATTHLVEMPTPLYALPGIGLALILGLAGGVSLGPENPVIAIAVGLAVWIARKIAPTVSIETVVMIGVAGVLGALFGSPVAAALLLTEMVGALKRGGILWDRMFAPLVAAASGAVVAVYFREDLELPELPAYRMTEVIDLFSGSVIAVIAAALGVVAAIALPWFHKVLHSLRHPVLYLGIGGLLLGVLGVIGGPITLFKGAHQAVELVDKADTVSAGQMVLIAVVKILALLVAAAASFRGGRIFPAMFVGIALGLLAHDLIPAIPQTLAVCAATLGFVMAVSRDGWLALFMAAVLAGGGEVLIPLCVIILPVWLVVAHAPEMIVPKPKAEPEPEPAKPDPEPAAT